MRVAHASDLHGNLLPIKTVANSWATQEFDVWLFSGDMFPNCTRGIVERETKFQENWFISKRDALFKSLQDKPIICVDGNHDFISIAEMLKKYAYQGDVYSIHESHVITFKGYKFAGHRYIPYIDGEWNGEKHIPEMSDITNRLFQQFGDSDVLVTHAAPSCELAPEYGCNTLSNALSYLEHTFRYHFFGHIHEYGGKVSKLGNTMLYNNATKCEVILL